MKRGRPRSRPASGLDFPEDGTVEIHDVGEDGVAGGTDMCGMCGTDRAAHSDDGRGGNAATGCKRFRRL